MSWSRDNLTAKGSVNGTDFDFNNPAFERGGTYTVFFKSSGTKPNTYNFKIEISRVP